MKIEQFHILCEEIQPSETGCRLWESSVSKGYPLIRISKGRGHGSKKYRANRLVLEKKLGREILPGKWALHSCDVMNCVEENHLYEGTPQQNHEDMYARGRANPVRGDEHYTRKHPELMPRGPQARGTFKLNKEKIKEIKSLLNENVLVSIIAKKFDINEVTVRNIKNRKTWRNVCL